jgi:hypothetical protein
MNRDMIRCRGGSGRSVVRNKLEPSWVTEYLLVVWTLVWLTTCVVEVILPLGPPAQAA